MNLREENADTDRNMGKQTMESGVAGSWSPLVTALVPSYNAEAFIQKTLDSLAAQSWPCLEILIGDDASSDRTPEIIREFAARHDNVRVLERERNLGWRGNSNDLMANAAGELMFFAFHDDLVAPDYVTRLVEALRANPDAILAFSDVELVEVDGSRSTLSFRDLERTKTAFMRALIMAVDLGIRSWWIPNRGLFRKQAFEKIGGIPSNKSGEFGADWTWLLHMSTLGPLVRVPECLCCKIRQKTSLSLNWGRSRLKYMNLIRRGILEIKRSQLSTPAKIVICGYLRLPLFYLGLTHLGSVLIAHIRQGIALCVSMTKR